MPLKPQSDLASVTSPTPGAVRVSEEQARAGELAASLVDVVYALRLEPDMGFEYVSPSVEAMVGYTPQEHYDDPGLGMRLLDPRDQEVLLGSVQAAIGETVSMTVRWVAKDGHTIWTEHRCVKQRRDDGSVVLYGAARDVTEQHLTAEHYRLLAENSTDVVIRSDTERRITWVAPTVTAALGWNVDDLRGTRITDFMRPEEVERRAADRVAFYERGEDATPPEGYLFELRAKDGAYRWFAGRGHPVHDELGQPAGVVAGLTDVTELVNTRQQLASLTDEYRLLAENASDVVYQVGPDRQVTWISPSVTDALGWTVDELTGASMYDLVHPEDQARIASLREAVFAGRGIVNPAEGYPSRFRRKDGSYVWMSLKTSTVTDADGRFVKAVTGMRNVDALIAERQRAEHEAARRQSLLETLLDPHVLLQSVRDDSGAIVDFVYVDANEAACEYNHTPREALIGKRLLELLPGHAGRGLLAMYAAAVESGEPLILNDYAYPNEVQQEVRFYDIRAVRVGDALSYTWRDVTERHEAVRQLAESEERFRLLAENQTDVIVQSRGGKMRWISPSLTTVLGWDPSEWVGHAIEDFTHPDDIGEVRTRRKEVGSGIATISTLRLRDKVGAYHWVEVHAGSYTDADSHVIGIVASFRVVDDEVASRVALSEAEEHYRLLAENSTDVIGLARNGRVAWISPSVTASLGGLPSEWIGRDLAEVIHPDDLPRHLASLSLRGDQLAGVVRVRLLAEDGTYRWVEAHTGPFIDRNGNEDGVIASFRVIDDVVQAERELDHYARFDALTGLANRKEILKRIRGIASGTRKPGEYTAVLFCDIDRFKEVNDTYGHVAGDEVLRTVAERISVNVRKDDAAARIGGDELLVVLTGIHSVDEAAAIAEKIRAATAVSIVLEDGRVAATMSIGVTLVRHGESADDLIARADRAMYQAKAQGRNQVIAI